MTHPFAFSKKWLANFAFVVAATVGAGAAHAETVTTTTLITLDLVTITGSRELDMGNIYAERITPSYGAALASPFYGGRVSMDREMYNEYKAMVAAIKLNPLTSPDVRCNANATNPTRQTTSQSDATDRFLAAQQLFAAISMFDKGASARGLSRNTPDYLFNGAKQFTFQVTYADGGKERWIVGSFVSSALVIEGNVPNSLSAGDGTIQPCPDGSIG